jgi:GNAT superfamily N-acetyltransferase
VTRGIRRRSCPNPDRYVDRVPSSAVDVRPAAPSDVEWLFSMVVELATYERAPDQVTGTRELLDLALFGREPSAEAVVAEVEGERAGFALFHGTFSTWEARPGLWLEDLYVREVYRRAGVGQALLQVLAETALRRGCARLEWAALDWNEPALRFYERIEARRLDDWVIHRLDGEALRSMARRADVATVPSAARTDSPPSQGG